MPNGLAMPGRRGTRLVCGCYAPPSGMLAAMAVNAASSGFSPVNVEAAAGARSKSAGEGASGLVIDCHGHYTTEPKALRRSAQAPDRRRIGHPSRRRAPTNSRSATTKCARASKARSSGCSASAAPTSTIFSPRASGMGHHVGDAAVTAATGRGSRTTDPSRADSSIRRISSASASCRSRPACAPKNCIAELERCVNELGFVGCNLNPGSVGRLLERAAADRQIVVSALREDGRARRAGDGPCQRFLQCRASTPPARTTSTATPPRSCSS